MTSQHKLLILDYGGVYSYELTHNDINTLMTRVFTRIPTPAEQVLIAPVTKLLAANKIDTKEYVHNVAETMGVPVPNVGYFEKTVIDVTHPPSPSMQELVAQTRKSGVSVSLLSNMYRFEVLTTRPWGRFDGFDFTSFSCEAQLTKSDPAFFQLTLDHFNLSVVEVLFVDDVPEYTEVALSLGIDTILADKLVYGNADELADAIREKL